MRQVGQAGHRISTALLSPVYVNALDKKGNRDKVRDNYPYLSLKTYFVTHH